MSQQQPNDPKHSEQADEQSKQAKTRPTAPADRDEANESLPELDEGPRPGPVDEIQQALFDALVGAAVKSALPG